jgi:mono/diheme cytochrome c family protein
LGSVYCLAGATPRRFSRGEMQDKNHEINLGRNTMKTILATLGISALLGVLAALAVIYSGIFNVAATVEDAPPLRWVFITTREASIKRHARDIQAPALGGAEQVERGFRLYREMCVMCHTPVGRPPTPMAIGLNPQAPGFAENDMSAAELFWAIKNGIRFTGMSAWGPSRSDQEIWDMVAFIQVLPKISAVDYDALDRRVLSGPGPQK